MRQRCISGDSHIDLSWLPPDLFVANASSAYRERMPYVEDTPKGALDHPQRPSPRLCLRPGRNRPSL
jgi:hypothetical protein